MKTKTVRWGALSDVNGGWMWVSYFFRKVPKTSRFVKFELISTPESGYCKYSLEDHHLINHTGYYFVVGKMLIVSRDSHTQNIIHFSCLCHTFVFYTWTFYMSGCSLIMCSDWKGPSYIFLPTHWLVNANFEEKAPELEHNSWRKPPKNGASQKVWSCNHKSPIVKHADWTTWRTGNGKVGGIVWL